MEKKVVISTNFVVITTNFVVNIYKYVVFVNSYNLILVFLFFSSIL